MAARVATESSGRNEELLFSWTEERLPNSGPVTPESAIQNTTTVMASQSGLRPLVFVVFPENMPSLPIISSLNWFRPKGYLRLRAMQSNLGVKSKLIAVEHLGIVEYQSAWQKQREIQAGVISNEFPSTLLLL